MSAFMFFDVVPARLALPLGPMAPLAHANEICAILQPLQAADVKHLYVNCYRNDFLSLITKTYAGFVPVEVLVTRAGGVSHRTFFACFPPP
jgi:hypothetical protein